MSEVVYLGRQPIFDALLKLAGYELLYRASADGPAAVSDDDDATRQVLVNTLVHIGVNEVLGAQRGFVNVTQSWLDSGLYRALPPERVVLELLEHQRPDRALVETLRRVRSEGYQVALDDFVFDGSRDELVSVADIVKVDLPGVDPATLDEQLAPLRDSGVLLLAEKVETAEQLDFCRELGFDLYQGYFFQRPQVMDGRTLAPDRLATVQLLAELEQPDIDLDTLDEIISRDVTLTYRVLRVVNSAHSMTSARVESVRQALLMLGLRTVKSMAMLVSMASVDDKPAELITTALVRAKMCERLVTPLSAELGPAAFTTGLLSVLDALMDIPMESVLGRLPIAEHVSAAILTREGLLGEALGAAIAFERFGLEHFNGGSLSLPHAAESYAAAVSWADGVRAQLAT